MVVIKNTDLRSGMKIVYENELWIVTHQEHISPGKGQAFTRVKLKRYSDGRVVEKTLRENDRVDQADFITKTTQYLYEDQGARIFMDNESYEQFEISDDVLGLQAKFLIPNSDVIVSFYNGEPVGVELPPKLVFEVTETIDDIARGNTANAITKDATLETGLVVQVPPFIKTGEKIRVSTVDGSYVERA